MSGQDVEDFDPEDDLPLSVFQNRGLSEANINNFLVSNDDIDCQEPLNDEDIIRQVTDQQDNENEEELETSESVARIPHTKVVSCFGMGR